LFYAISGLRRLFAVVVRRTSQRIEFLSTGRDTGVKAIDEDQEVKNDSKNYKLTKVVSWEGESLG